VNQAGIEGFAKLEGQEISGLLVSSRLVCRCGDVEKPCSDTCGGTPPDVFVEVTAIDSVGMLLKYPGLPTKIGITRTATFRAPP
jgi:hypothetical protein